MARETMGFDFGLDDSTTCFKRKNRWLFKIDGISADTKGIDSLPPSKAARPSVSFKELEAQHVTETIYFPGKPEWKPITLSLYDLKRNKHPIFEWLKQVYDPNGDGGNGTYKPSADGWKKQCTLEMYDGCGNVIETWTFDNAWPQSIEFGDLDMTSSEVLTCEVTLRYDRAYIS